MWKKKALLAGFVAAAGALAIGSSAQAAMVATFAGTIERGFDATGAFGPGVTDLAGKGFTLVYRYDPNDPAGTTGPYDPSLHSSEIFQGGPNVFTAAMSIEGVEYFNAGRLFGYALFLEEPSWPLSQVSYEVEDEYDDPIDSDYHYTINMRAELFSEIGNNICPPPASVNNVFSYTLQPGEIGSGEFSFHRRHDTTGDLDPNRAYAFLRPTSVTVAWVPEPGAWALMIVGFGMTGGLLRARRGALAVG